MPSSHTVTTRPTSPPRSRRSCATSPCCPIPSRASSRSRSRSAASPTSPPPSAAGAGSPSAPRPPAWPCFTIARPSLRGRRPPRPPLPRPPEPRLPRHRFAQAVAVLGVAQRLIGDQRREDRREYAERQQRGRRLGDRHKRQQEQGAEQAPCAERPHVAQAKGDQR